MKIAERFPVMHLALLVASLVLGYGSAGHAATVNSPETWSGGTMAGWVGYDLVNETVTTALSVENGALKLRYAAQSVALPPDEQVIKAAADASGGRFTGNYLDAGVQAVKFRIKPDQAVSASLLLHSDASGRRWRYALTGLTAGEWNDVTVPVDPAALKLLNGDKSGANFAADLQNVSWIGIDVVRNPSMAEQNYRLDDVQLIGAGEAFAAYMRTAAGGGAWTQDMLATADLDHDGSDNFSEFVAGTDADVSSDVLVVKTQPLAGAEGVRLSWKSEPGRIYRVLRSTSPDKGFAEISGDLPATAADLTLDDATAGGPFFYRVSVRRP